MIIDLDTPTKEIERRKVIRDVWNYKLDNIDHIPIQLIPIPNSKGYTLKERYTDKKKQLEVQEVEKIKAGLQLMPDSYQDGLMPEKLERVRYLIEDTGYLFSCSLLGYCQKFYERI